MTIGLPRLRSRAGAITLMAASWLGGRAIAGDPPTEPSKPPSAQDRLERLWPGHPEWLAEVVAILLPDDDEEAPGGWYRKAVAKSRFEPKATVARLDKDRDGRVTREEFPGTDGDFARLDRDADRALTESDFDFSPTALDRSPGTMLFARIDRDGDGKLTREEMDGFFARADSGNLGFLSLNDARAALDLPPEPPRAPDAKPARDPGEPSKATLLKGFLLQEIGSHQAGPAVEEEAPDFTLRTVDGSQEVTLSRLVGPKPVVLVFGNFTCGPFRNQAGNVEKLYRRYKDRATFAMVYVREAHPTDGWAMTSNDRVGVAVRQPRSYEERVGVAQACSRRLDLGMPMLVDTIDDAVGARYSGMPSRLYLIDGAGRVAYKSGRGPFGFKPSELEHMLLLLLNDAATPAMAGAR